MALRSKTQRSLLLGFIASIACCGLVGIYCLAVGTIGWMQGRILLTTCAVGAASILALAAAVPWERRHWHPIGPLGFLAVTAAMAYSLILIWVVGNFDEDVYKGFGITCVVAVALPHVGLISLARLRRQWAFLKLLTVAAIVVLAAQIIVMILFESNEDLWFRLLGILSIAVACGTIAMPILHRVSAIQTREAVKTVELTLSIVCPRCGKQQSLPAGRSACTQCSLRFLIEIEEDACRKCGYPLYKLESAVCPECGTPIAAAPTVS